MNVYRIGVSIAMTNGVSPVLGVIAKDVLGLHGNVGKLEKGFSRLKLAIGGALAVAGGVTILGAMGKMLNASEDLTKEQGKLLAAGLSNQKVAEATAKAWDMSRNIMGARVAENLAAVGHLRAAIGDLKEAERIAPAYQRNAVALGAIMGRPGEVEAYKLAQAIHLSGAANDPLTKKLDANRFAAQMNLYTAMIAAGNGKLSPQDLLQFQKQAGSYGGNLTNEGRINLVGLIQAIGGTRAGTIISSLNRALKDGVLQKSTLEQLEKVGLIDPRKVVTHKGKGIGNGGSPGGGVSFMPGALLNEKQFREDTAGWVWATLVPLLRAHGITDVNDQVNFIQHTKLTANPTRGLSEMIRNEGVDKQEAANVRQASKADQYNAVMGKSFEANKKALSDAWHDFLTALAVPLVPMAIHTLQGITDAIKGMTNWARIHPGQVKLIGGALAVLGAALIGFGAVAIGVAAFAAVSAGGMVGLVIAGIGAVIGAVTALVAMNWKEVKGAGEAVWDFIKTVWQAVEFIQLHPFEAARQALSALMPKGFHQVTPEEAAKNNANPFNTKMKPGAWWLDLSPRGFSPGDLGTGAANGNKPAANPPAAKPQKMAFNGYVLMDGQHVGRIVSGHQADSLDRTSAAVGSGVDPRMALVPVSYSA